LEGDTTTVVSVSRLVDRRLVRGHKTVENTTNPVTDSTESTHPRRMRRKKEGLNAETGCIYRIVPKNKIWLGVEDKLRT
jgi:hypothetical protein